ncbi:hypothetical protein GALMADRAFT_95263 [Galerina marginata CBS 339.88]|uniref:Antifreeze protein n=1 Tax=Galerina marginata (strain CBS 339.88) TaxID=685588 RepID=A0A067T355_GALM3|nr:hypothetical protein GALMADRAFT_95263 [Galerina marginata CBS 339.88]
MAFKIATFCLGLVCAVDALAVRAVGPPAVNLGTAGGYTIIAQAGVSTVPSSKITGNVGVSAIAATGLTGFSLVLDSTGTFSKSAQVSGKLLAASYTAPTPAILTVAVVDMQAAFVDGAGRANPDFVNLAGGLLGGLTLKPGLYVWSTTVSVATDITISGGSSDTWIFQIAGTFDLGTDVKVTLKGGARPKNIFWVVSGAVTLHAGSSHKGIILGKTGITAQTGTIIKGRLFAQTAVALQMTTISA